MLAKKCVACHWLEREDADQIHAAEPRSTNPREVAMTDEIRTPHKIESSRRQFLGALGAGVAAAGSLAAPSETVAQGARPLKIVDFHNHYMGPSWTLTNLASVPPAALPAWEKINSNLQSQSALLSSVESAKIAARVINTPTAFIE